MERRGRARSGAVRAAFAEAVAAGRADAVRPLPAPHVPLARRLLGDAPLPAVSAGPRTAGLLQAAGAEAATHHSTIYLGKTPGSDRRTRSVVAHELVHVAHGGDAPRFLGDETADAEERTARRVEAESAAPPTTTATADAAEPEAEDEAAQPAIDIDEVMEQITDRVLVEIERRGGRYRGVF